MEAKALRHALSRLLAVVLAAGGMAVAAAAPGAAEGDQTISGTASPIWQTNNEVHAMAVSGGTLYAGGTFTTVRPPGSSTTTGRTYLAGFSTATGALTSFNVTLNGRVRALDVSPDGTKLYVGGDFTTVNGTTRNRLAAINLPAGTLATGFTANANAAVTSLKATATALYVGGDFSTLAGAAKARIGAVNATTGANIAGFAASTDNRVYTIAVDEDEGRVLLGGSFLTINGVSQPYIGSVDSATGASRPWAANGLGNCQLTVKKILNVDDHAYVTAEGGPPGCWEGVYKANVADGSIVWEDECLGAGQALAAIGSQIYFGSHTHDCARVPGGFTGPNNNNAFIWYRLNVLNAGTGDIGHWTPNTNAAGTTSVGPQVMATDGSQIFVGGDFTNVNGTAQQGLTRFAVKGVNTAPTTPGAPTATAVAPGHVKISVPGTSDRDNGTLTYQLFRDAGTTPIATQAVESWPYSLPKVTFTDTAPGAAGASVRYRVRVSDGSALTGYSAYSATVTVPASAPAAFASTVTGSSPWWRFNDLTDSSGNGTQPLLQGGAAVGQPGFLTGDGALATDGATGYAAAASPQVLGASFTVSTWFRTTGRLGGGLLGYSDAQTGAGTSSDRVVWLDNDGKVVAGIRTAATGGGPGARIAFARSPLTYRDGAWHQVAATYNGTTLLLYIDGQQVASATGTAANPLAAGGYLRAGYVNLGQFNTVFGRNFRNRPAPSSHFFDGSIDETAAYPVVLTAGQIAQQYVSGAAGS
ncbi:LamG-like jellyroll fold domain-containing protein [Actinocorallia longicatena]|uniref:LamG-like jellyroll fold domain-containing protein n=1 Tax=Actinocorallia longicatena TaxID=111803 RepID=A0ABP6Q556_9ACTN